MKYVALKALPHGQQPGDVFEESTAIGEVLILVGAARKAEPDEDVPQKTPSTSRAPRRYQRRDLRVEE